MEIVARKKHPNHRMVVIAREARSISQTELAGELNISQGNLSKIEQGIYPLSEELINEISCVLNYPINFFYEKIDKIPVSQQFHRKTKDNTEKIPC